MPLMWTSAGPWMVLHPRGGRWLLRGRIPSGAEPWCTGPQVKVEQMALELRLTPLTVLLRSVLDQLQEKDPARIFAQPVSLKEVGVLASCTGLPRVCSGPGDVEDPSQCVRVRPEELGCPAVLREHGVCLCVYVCTRRVSWLRGVCDSGCVCKRLLCSLKPGPGLSGSHQTPHGLCHNAEAARSTGVPDTQGAGRGL